MVSTSSTRLLTVQFLPGIEKKYFDKTSNYTDCAIYHSEHGHGSSYQTYRTDCSLTYICFVSSSQTIKNFDNLINRFKQADGLNICVCRL